MNEQKRKPVGILLTVILIAALLTVCLELGLSYLRPDTPGSIPKHLIHFGIMFALLGGAVLLCLFCTPFKKLWAWIDKHILTQETRPIAIDIIYAVIAGLMLLHHFYVILYYPTLPNGAVRFAPIWIIVASFTVFLGKLWRKNSFRLSSLFFIYIFENRFLNFLTLSGNDAVHFLSALYSLFICLGSFSTLRPSIQKPFLKSFCAIWTLTTLGLSIIGLYTAWTGNQITNFVGTMTNVENGRLSIFAYPTITASFTGCGSIMAIIGFTISKKKSTKILYLFICLITMVANALTDARTSFVVLSFMISSVLCISLWNIYINRNTEIPRKMTAIVVAGLFLCFGICFYGTIEGQRYLGALFINFRNNDYDVISSAKADEPLLEVPSDSLTIQEPPQFEQRDIWLSEDQDFNSSLSGRVKIWNRVFKYLHDNPDTILFGLSIERRAINWAVWDVHCHNLLIQILIEEGIFGLCLFLSLLSFNAFYAFRLWSRKRIPFWQRVLPLPVFSILLWEMAECLSHFSFGHPPMTLLWFFLGATITISKSLGKTPKTAEQPTIPAESAVTETGE